LAVDNIKTKKPLLQSDINILMGIAGQIGISIHNAKLIDARFRQFQCNELGLSYNYTEMIRVASLLHDYGKIGVDDAILKKPGRLTPSEYEHIKTHAPKTRDILDQVNFEGIYTEVPEIAGAHHEKLDGTGYPNGLFEALTSKRHYRDPMPLDDAFNYLVENIDIHFERECVEALINFYNKNFTDIPYVPKGKLGN
jgi:HD-GYP domain-containing protein (c-di-GMP phosphodiesterase class II)